MDPPLLQSAIQFPLNSHPSNTKQQPLLYFEYFNRDKQKSRRKKDYVATMKISCFFFQVLVATQPFKDKKNIIN